MKLEHSVMQNVMQKTNSKWIKGLNVRPDTIKLLQENIGRTFWHKSLQYILLDPHPRVMEIKTKINKWDLIKLKNFCTAKENNLLNGRKYLQWCNQQGINLQNIQTAHAAQYQKATQSKT